MSFVNKITSDNYVSYTMRLVEPLDASYSYSNIVIQERNGVEEIFTIRYINDDNARTNGTDGMNMKSGIIPYDGWEDPDDGNTGGGDDDFVEICNDIRVLTPIPCGCGHMPWETCKGSTCGNPLYPSLEIVTQQECYLDYTGGNGNTGGTGNIASGNTGGGTNQDPTDPEDPDIVTTPISSVLPDGALLTIAECITPNQEQLDWINEQQTKPDGSPNLVSIWNYVDDLDNNECADQLNQSFFKQAIDAFDSGGKVDFENRIIKDSTFFNNEKVNCIYDKLTQSPKFKTLFIDTFGESDAFNVTFKVVNNISVNGITGSLPNSINNINRTTGEVNLNLLIRLNEQYINSSSAIAVAKTILHESIHAYLKLKYIKCNIGTPFDDIIDDIDDKNLEELLNYYYDTACPEEEQHEFIFANMIPTMQDILADIRDSLIPENHQQNAEALTFIDETNPSGPEINWNWNEFYKYFSMAGLQNTDAFQFEMLPVDSPKYQNYTNYINTGINSFTKNCID